MKLKLNAGGAVTGAAAEIWSLPVRTSQRALRIPITSPSLRMPATRENRERLRTLREAEFRNWTAVSPSAALRAEVQESLARSRFESWLIGGVAGVAAISILIGAASSLDFVTHWNQFVSLVHALIG